MVMKGARANGVYLLQGVIEVTIESETRIGVDSSRGLDATRLWHLRLGHVSEKDLEILQKREMIDGESFSKLEFCEECFMGKQTRVSFVEGKHDSRGVLEYVHMDVWGPTPVASLGGAKYYISFIYDFSRKVWVYVMKAKSEAFARFKEWRALVENESGKSLKILRSDNAGEYVSGVFLDYCKHNGIRRHFTTPGDRNQIGLRRG